MAPKRPAKGQINKDYKFSKHPISDSEEEDETTVFTDKLHVPTQHFTGPQTSRHNIENVEPADNSDRISRHHDIDYANNHGRDDADNHFVGEQMTRGDNPWAATLGAIGIGLAQLSRHYGVDLSEAFSKSKKTSMHRNSMQPYQRFIGKHAKGVDNQATRMQYYAMRQIQNEHYQNNIKHDKALAAQARGEPVRQEQFLTLDRRTIPETNIFSTEHLEHLAELDAESDETDTANTDQLDTDREDTTDEQETDTEVEQETEQGDQEPPAEPEPEAGGDGPPEDNEEPPPKVYKATETMAEEETITPVDAAQEGQEPMDTNRSRGGGSGGGGGLGNFNFPDSYQESYKRGDRQFKVSAGKQVFTKEFWHSIPENKNPSLKRASRDQETHDAAFGHDLPIIQYDGNFSQITFDQFPQFMDPSAWQDMAVLFECCEVKGVKMVMKNLRQYWKKPMADDKIDVTTSSDSKVEIFVDASGQFQLAPGVVKQPNQGWTTHYPQSEDDRTLGRVSLATFPTTACLAELIRQQNDPITPEDTLYLRGEEDEIPFRDYGYFSRVGPGENWEYFVPVNQTIHFGGDRTHGLHNLMDPRSNCTLGTDQTHADNGEPFHIQADVIPRMEDLLNAEKTDALSCLGLQAQIGVNHYTKNHSATYSRARRDRINQGTHETYQINDALQLTLPQTYNETMTPRTKDNKGILKYSSVITIGHEFQLQNSTFDNTLSGIYPENRHETWNYIFDVIEVPTVSQPALPLILIRTQEKPRYPPDWNLSTDFIMSYSIIFDNFKRRPFQPDPMVAGVVPAMDLGHITDALIWSFKQWPHTANPATNAVHNRKRQGFLRKMLDSKCRFMATFDPIFCYNLRQMMDKDSDYQESQATLQDTKMVRPHNRHHVATAKSWIAAQQVHHCMRKAPKKPGQLQPRGPAETVYGSIGFPHTLETTLSVDLSTGQIPTTTAIHNYQTGALRTRKFRSSRGLKLKRKYRHGKTVPC
uniref:Putative structural VP n=1 Tax=Millport starfish parvo-like virus 1 TaxID=2021901 RepID=A0A221LFM3_9VIRU|nr:putative structural VP [Millport starfish parvo-like virus 1]